MVYCPTMAACVGVYFKLVACAGLALVFRPSTAFGAEEETKIDRANADVRGTAEERERSARHAKPADDTADGGADHDIFGAVLAGLFNASPAANASSDSDPERKQESRGLLFLGYPYEAGNGSYAHYEKGSLRSGRQPFSGNIGIEGGDAGGGTSRLAARSNLVLSWVVFEGGIDQFSERTRDQRLTLVEALAGFQASGHWLTARVHGGARWLEGDGGWGNPGWDLGTQIQLFPIRPLVFQARFDGGRVGESSLFRASATVGAMLNRVELFGGYDLLAFETVGFYGPMAGMRVWY